MLPNRCVDAIAMCEEWAKKGECLKNEQYMQRNCCCACAVKCSDTDGADGDDRNELLKEEAESLGKKTLVLTMTSAGSKDVGGDILKNREIRIRLLGRRSPKIVKEFVLMANENTRGHFYRSEKVPKNGAIDNFGGPGPPYALIQARTEGKQVARIVGKEFAPLVERGFLCLIGEGPDFFIAIGAHHEWGFAHSVFGVVLDEESLKVADAITNLPVKEEVWGQTHVTSLVNKLEFAMTLVEE